MQVHFVVYAEHNTKGRTALTRGRCHFAPTQLRGNAWGHTDSLSDWKMADCSAITADTVFSEGSPFAQGGKVQLALGLQLLPHG